ncbi:hypothetical protein SUDANB6_05749 [Streptomyces sp. enrichment culture]
MEAVRLLLGAWFDDLGVHRIRGARFPLDEASARTLAVTHTAEGA